MADFRETLDRESALREELKRVKAERDRMKEGWKQAHRDGHTFFEQSCKNLSRAESAERDAAATLRELERWRHGQQIEGDYVCPHQQAAAAMRTVVERIAAEVEDWVHGEGCSRGEECDDSDGLTCMEHGAADECPPCDCGKGPVLELTDAALSPTPEDAPTINPAPVDSKETPDEGCANGCSHD